MPKSLSKNYARKLKQKLCQNMEKIEDKTKELVKVKTKKITKVKGKKLAKVRAKDRHKTNLLSYLAVWENKWPKNHIEMAAIIGIKPDTLRFHFSPAEINEIYFEGLELRKKNSFKQRKRVYDSMLKEAEKGNVVAQKEFLDRTEGKIIDKKKYELSGSIIIQPQQIEKKVIDD